MLDVVGGVDAAILGPSGGRRVGEVRASEGRAGLVSKTQSW